MKVIVNFLGSPSLVINGKKVSLPAKKITALVFYLLFEREVPRSRLTTLFWGEKSENRSAGSLRNSIYLIKKILPASLFMVDRKLIRVASDIELQRDLDELYRLDQASLTQVKRLAAEFLSGVLIEGEEFHHWLQFRRAEFGDLYGKKLKERIQSRLQAGQYDDAIHCLKLLIHQDNLDEQNYLQLMQVYGQAGHTSKAIKLYAGLVKILQDELAVEPCHEIRQCYQQLLNYNNRAKSSVQQESRFFGRKTEMETILGHISHASPGQNIYITLSGPQGIGKSFLVERMLDQLCSTRALYCRAYETSKKYPYSSWHSFFHELGPEVQMLKIKNPLNLHILKIHFPSFDVDYHLPDNINFSPLLQLQNPIQLGELLAELVNRLTLHKRRLIVLEDFQWFDQTSLEMLQSFLALAHNLLVIVLTSTGEGENILFERIAPKSGTRICKITLPPFSYQETSALCQLVLQRQPARQEMQRIYEESEGIPLYITEFLNILQERNTIDTLSDSIGTIMESRMASLTARQKRILEYLSVFSSEVPYSHLIEVYTALENEKWQELYLLEELEQLYHKNFIQEQLSESNQLKLQFCHNRIKAYVYSQMSEFRKRAIHSQAAQVLEAVAMKTVWDKALEHETLHHHHKTANEPAALTFQLVRLRRHVIINHELFPLIEDSDLRSCGLPFSTRNMTEQLLENAQEILNDIRLRYPVSEELCKATALYQEISGSYNIYFGNYKDGQYAVEQALKYSQSRQQTEIRMRCLLQLSFIGIQTEQIPAIMVPAQQLCEIATAHNSDLFLALALRFIGVAQQIGGQSEAAEQLFMQSKERLLRLARAGEYYTLNRLAVQNYIGELYHRRGLLRQAGDYFEQCLAECYEKNLFWGRPLFHSNIAYVALSEQQYDKAETHVDKAIQLFETTPSGRKSSIAYSIKSLLEGKKGHVEQALFYLRAGDHLCQPIGKKSWIGLQLWVKGQLKQMAQFNRTDDPCLALNQPAELYQKQADRLFNAICFNARILGNGETE